MKSGGLFLRNNLIVHNLNHVIFQFHSGKEHILVVKCSPVPVPKDCKLEIML